MVLTYAIPVLPAGENDGKEYQYGDEDSKHEIAATALEKRGGDEAKIAEAYKLPLDEDKYDAAKTLLQNVVALSDSNKNVWQLVEASFNQIEKPESCEEEPSLNNPAILNELIGQICVLREQRLQQQIDPDDTIKSGKTVIQR